ncbi:hypothetical protein AMIS_18820 [Actinoplanes missouriensis 431]|uniref:Uncharacterized protein n=1 Tax=Actinoplanes missouriensis (strain ATCC 14538 / DSM 43046 / CBS 188.64 / JCM 3121 / NBRC 102363 / NCIMB 12654 / NRRL B-3342 / UNCC 431) TaxID=512565 RepID=I0H265_ACTM4|nr:hypothetical protein [Actinoplanes missouriensis]BAL87102.1 hypothetical protein AMIS_18820 [Actinoplanes missouriensis 431]
MRRTLPAPHLVAAGITAVVLAPLALPGYVLRYDMVFVPRQPLSWEMIAPADALPRAVPLDALVSLANLAVPGWLLQRICLVALVYLAALGAARLVPSGRALTRAVASFGYAWTPFLAERLLLGQWALLFAYAAMPWLVLAVRDLRAGRPGALPRLVLAAAPAAVTPTGGLIALVTVAVLLPLHPRAPGKPPEELPGKPPRSPATAVALAAVAALNAPWIVAALTSAAGGSSDPEGVAQFAARAENWAGTWTALAGTGGVWNAQTVPGSRTSVLAPLVTVVLLAGATIGLRVLWQRWRGDAVRLFVLAGGGFVLAVAGATPAAGLLRWLVVHVPGAGLLRDGQKFLIPYALVLALGFALGAEWLAKRMSRRFEPGAGRVLLVSAVLLPVVAMPDLAFGGLGALRPVPYPVDFDEVAARVDAAPGEVLSLPFEGYQRASWNRNVVIRDPAPRYLDAPVLMNDALRVGTVTVDGESPRAALAQRLLAAGRPAAELGVRWVLVRTGTSGSPVAGLRLVYSGQYLQLWENPAVPPAPRASSTERRAPALAAHLLYLAVVIFAAFALLRMRSRSWYGPPNHESGEEE